MRDPNTGAVPWASSPTAKEKNAAQKAVTALLDALAPEPAVRRAERPRLRVEQHRTPAGCVLQAADAALTVSWFPDASEDSALGELHVVVWRGTVARRGSPRSRERAVVTREFVVRPVEHPSDTQVWRDAEGRTYDTESLAAHCLAMLEKEIGESASGDEPGEQA
jgi:hypothetical protein